MTSPNVSVVMPVYNAQRYVQQAVRSVLDQDYADFEFVIIDDGSTDQSPDILRRLAASDGRIKLVSRANTGLVGALNEGLALAQGDLIARMDADDISLPQRFGRQVRYLNEHPQCVAVGSRILLIDDEDMPICEMCEQGSHEEIDQANLLGGGAALNHPAVMFRAAAAAEVGGYRQEFYPGEDLDLWLRMAEIGRLANLRQVFLKYRVHINSISHARILDQRHKWRMAVTAARRRRGCDAQQGADKIAANMRTKNCSRAEHHIRWAWTALMHGNLKTARKHTWTSLRLKPLSIETWRLACCAARGY